MTRRGQSRATLRAERDVSVQDGHFLAESDEPWLSIEPLHLARWADRFVEVTFRLSILDEPARPIIRFWLQNGRFIDRIGAAPIAGAGSWIGRVPRETRRISVSPTNRQGLFDFRIEQIRLLSWWSLVVRGFRSRPLAARSMLLTRLIGWKPESDVNMAWAISARPLNDYPRCYTDRTRKLDLDGFDRPRFDWGGATPISIIIIGDNTAGVERTLLALSAQGFQLWAALVLADVKEVAGGDPRIETCTSDNLYSRISKDPNATLTCVLRAGDVLLPAALAYVAEQGERHPTHCLFYGDAVLLSAIGKATPRFQPGWSPRLHRATGFPEPPVFVRNLKTWSEIDVKTFIAGGALPRVAALPPSAVKPLRRILLTTAEPVVEARTAAPRENALVTTNATAAIIILTRDHPALLHRVVTSIRTHTRPGSFRIIIVDNGSTTAEAKALVGELSVDPAIERRDYAGIFNFSLMCNEAAAATKEDVLVFLNDDTQVLTDGWLERLVGHALDPAIGAVGAKMTYPDGRLQHIGVLVGMGESAGHLGALDKADALGWAGRNVCLHEVSAVTGACLAVARAKFEAVGGFDAEHLPIELSDVDLCLKLNARGWQTVVDPAVHLMHEESASRGGATFRRLDVYALQRAVFVERWRHVLRDDPFFHPGLSLYSLRAALG